MSTLYITEFKALRKDQNGQYPQVGSLPALAEQTVTLSGTSAKSSPFNGETRMIRVESDVICSVKVSANPTATATNMRVAADSPEYFWVSPGDSIAGITNS